jgi:hypothetical protein
MGVAEVRCLGEVRNDVVKLGFRQAPFRGLGIAGLAPTARAGAQAEFPAPLANGKRLMESR